MNSKNVHGIPTLIVACVFPATIEPKGNCMIAIIIIIRNIAPKIVENLFVGVSSFGIVFVMMSVRDSLPAY